MSFKSIIDKAKNKFNEFIDKGNSELKKFQNTKDVILYSQPVLGGFVRKRAFYEDGKLLFPTNQFEKDEIICDTLIGLDDDKEYYVIRSLSPDPIIKEVKTLEKVFTYECYEATYEILNDSFTKDVDGLPFYELTVEKEKLLNDLRIEIENNPLALKEKKELCLELWKYFTECIQYNIKDHYVVIAFSRIAKEYVKDYSTYLIKLFA